MSVEVCPQKLLGKRKRQGTNFKTLEGTLAATYTHSAPRSLSDPSTKGLFARLLFLHAQVQLPSPHLWLREIFAPGISLGLGYCCLQVWILLQDCVGLFLFKKFHEDSCCAWNSGLVWGLHALPLPSESGALGSLWIGFCSPAHHTVLGRIRTHQLHGETHFLEHCPALSLV